jgi:hypothetical protein
MWQLWAEWGTPARAQFYKRTSDLNEVLRWLRYDGEGYDSHFTIPSCSIKQELRYAKSR